MDRPHRRRWSRAGSAAALSFAALTGCTTPAPVTNTGGLPPEAVSLRYILDQGCLPIALGEKTEHQALGSIGLRYSTLDIGLVGPNGPGWLSRYPGVHRVNAGPRGCYFTVFGPDVATYEQVAGRVFQERLGPHPTHPPTERAQLMGTTAGCSRSVRCSYTPLPARTFPGELFVSASKRPGLEVTVSADTGGCSASGR